MSHKSITGIASRLKRPRRFMRRGLTLTELLVASTIMVMIVGAMSMLAMTVHSANDHCQGQTRAAQHGRVTIELIGRTVSGATASEQFPGCLVVTEDVGSWEMKDTLFVWSPETVAVDPAGLPRIEELVLFTPDPAQPNHLLMIRSPGDSGVAPAVSDVSAWRTLAAALRTDAGAERVVLTDRLRTGAIVEQAGEPQAADLRGCLRFTRLIAPSEEEWQDYRNGDKDWEDLAWALDAYSSLAGTRRVACQVELQIVPNEAETAAVTAVPFFGSAGLSYELSR